MPTETTPTPPIAPGSAFRRTWWINEYPNGQISGRLFTSEKSGLDCCTYTGETPDAQQIEVHLVRAAPSAVGSAALEIIAELQAAGTPNRPQEVAAIIRKHLLPELARTSAHFQ